MTASGAVEAGDPHHHWPWYPLGRARAGAVPINGLGGSVHLVLLLEPEQATVLAEQLARVLAMRGRTSGEAGEQPC